MKKRILSVLLALCLIATPVFAGFSDGGAFGDMVNYLKRVGTSIVPATTNTYNLGSPTAIWANAYIGTLVFGASSITLSTGSWIGLGAAKGRWVFTDAAVDLLNALNTAVKIGDGSPTQTQADEDLYVEGKTEIDGTTYLDGAVNILGAETMGTAAANAGVFSMIQGAVASDPTFSITQATNDVTIAQTVGLININPATNLVVNLPATGTALIEGDVTRTGTNPVLDIDATYDTTTATADVTTLDLDITRAATDTGGMTGIDLTMTTDNMANGELSKGVNIDIYGGAAGTATSTLTGLMLSLTDGTASCTEYGAYISNGWDTALQVFDPVVLGDSTHSADLSLHDASTVTMYEDGDNFSASANCKDGAAEWQFNDDVNIGTSNSDAENLYIHHGGTETVYSAGNDKNIQISHNDTNGLITSSDGTISFDNENLTTTGTVTGEQLTSTDDVLVTDALTMGTADANSGVFSMIQGAVASDPTFSITQATNDVTIAQTVGNLTISAAGDLQLTATGGQVGVTGEVQGSTYSTQKQYDEIGILLSNLTAPKTIVGFTGTGATTTTENGYESGAGRVWTYTGGLVDDKIFQGSTYVYSFDGIDSYLSTPDTADMTFSTADTADTAFSIGGWVQVVDTAVAQTIFAKYDGTTAAKKREYVLNLGVNENIGLYQYDDSADKQVSRVSDAAPSVGWHYIVVTQSGTGGATAMNTALIYVDGVVVASTAANDASYVAMENTTTLPTVGAYTHSTGAIAKFFSGDMGRVFVTGEALSAATIWKQYIQTKGFYNK